MATEESYEQFSNLGWIESRALDRCEGIVIQDPVKQSNYNLARFSAQLLTIVLFSLALSFLGSHWSGCLQSLCKFEWLVRVKTQSASVDLQLQ
jgi:hypothetical protein